MLIIFREVIRKVVSKRHVVGPLGTVTFLVPQWHLEIDPCLSSGQTGFQSFTHLWLLGEPKQLEGERTRIL